MRLITVSLQPPRCYPLGRRLHHGPVGFLLLFHPDWRVRVVGAVIVASDWHDRHVWLRDLFQHPAWA